jgi:hypothetical protein
MIHLGIRRGISDGENTDTGGELGQVAYGIGRSGGGERRKRFQTRLREDIVA